jgi:hypothetical protein
MTIIMGVSSGTKGSRDIALGLPGARPTCSPSPRTTARTGGPVFANHADITAGLGQKG